MAALLDITKITWNVTPEMVLATYPCESAEMEDYDLVKSYSREECAEQLGLPTKESRSFTLPKEIPGDVLKKLCEDTARKYLNRKYAPYKVHTFDAQPIRVREDLER